MCTRIQNWFQYSHDRDSFVSDFSAKQMFVILCDPHGKISKHFVITCDYRTCDFRKYDSRNTQATKNEAKKTKRKHFSAFSEFRCLWRAVNFMIIIALWRECMREKVNPIIHCFANCSARHGSNTLSMYHCMSSWRESDHKTINVRTNGLSNMSIATPWTSM